MNWIWSALIGGVVGVLLGIGIMWALNFKRGRRGGASDWTNGFNRGVGMALAVFDSVTHSDGFQIHRCSMDMDKIALIRRALLDCQEIWS